MEHKEVIMVYFKSCPRCSGDQVLDSDEYGKYIACVACGYVAYPEEDEKDWAMQSAALSLARAVGQPAASQLLSIWR